ncbi:hypothetical protein PR048_012158, partial [Dryococelus australis]
MESISVERHHKKEPIMEQLVRQKHCQDFKRVYTEVTIAIGSELIIHTLDDSAPIADLQGNKKQVESLNSRISRASACKCTQCDENTAREETSARSDDGALVARASVALIAPSFLCHKHAVKKNLQTGGALKRLIFVCMAAGIAAHATRRQLTSQERRLVRNPPEQRRHLRLHLWPTLAAPALLHPDVLRLAHTSCHLRTFVRFAAPSRLTVRFDIFSTAFLHICWSASAVCDTVERHQNGVSEFNLSFAITLNVCQSCIHFGSPASHAHSSLYRSWQSETLLPLVIFVATRRSAGSSFRCIRTPVDPDKLIFNARNARLCKSLRTSRVTTLSLARWGQRNDADQQRVTIFKPGFQLTLHHVSCRLLVNGHDTFGIRLFLVGNWYLLHLPKVYSCKQTLVRLGGRGGVAVRLLASHDGEPGFLGDLLFRQPLHSGAAPYPPHVSLTGSQDLDVKNHLILPTPLHLCALQHFNIRHSFRAGTIQIQDTPPLPQKSKETIELYRPSSCSWEDPPRIYRRTRASVAGDASVAGHATTPNPKLFQGSLCYLVVRLLASHLCEPDSIPVKVSMEQCRNEGMGEPGDSRENLSTSGIVRLLSHMPKSGIDSAGDRTRLGLLGGEHSNRSPTAVPSYDKKHFRENRAVLRIWYRRTPRAAVTGRLDCSPPTSANRVQSQVRVTPGFSRVGIIVPDDANGQRSGAGIQAGGNGKFPRKLANHQHRLERFPDAEIRSTAFAIGCIQLLRVLGACLRITDVQYRSNLILIGPVNTVLSSDEGTHSSVQLDSSEWADKMK